MKYCSKCGSQNPNEFNFCAKCGNSIEDAEIKPEETNEIADAVAAPTAEQKAKASKTGIAALILSIIGFLTAFIKVGLVLDIIAVALGIISLIQSKKKPSKKSLPIAGIIIAACSLILSLGIIWESVASIFNIGRSDATVAADNLIMEIGEVTLDSTDKIKQAEDAVSALSENEKDRLKYEKVLEKAKNEYTDLQAEEVENKISAIGEVTLDSDGAISDARNAFNNSTDEVKNLVSNSQVLSDAEKTLSQLRTANVENMIAKIGEVTLDSEAAVNEAQSEYDKLLDEDKQKVSNASALSAATAKLKELKLSSVMGKLTTETDKVQGATFYKPQCMPEYADIRCYILPYIGKDTNNTWLRMDIHYTGDSWVFFKSIEVVADGTHYSKSFNYFDVNHSNSGGVVWEWIDTEVGNRDIEMLKAIANSNETIVRYEGDTYTYDLTVTSADKQGIKDILTAYEAMK